MGGKLGPDWKLIWKGKICPKIKVFMWLVGNKAILTKDNLLKKNWTGGIPPVVFVPNI